MKKLRRFAAMMLAIIMATQNVAVACAETVESALNGDTAAVVEESGSQVRPRASLRTAVTVML